MTSRHVYQVYVRATPEAVWTAVTDPEWTRRYFHRTAVSAIATGQPFRYVMADGRDGVVGDVEVAEPPHRLVMTWRALYDAAMAEEPPSRVEWTIEAAGEGLTRVRVVHGDLARSPRTWASVREGWVWVLDGMKTLLETGEPLPDATAELDPPLDDVDGAWHRAEAIRANGRVWELLERDGRTADDDEDLLAAAYASQHHWRRAAGREPANDARAHHLLAKVHVALGHADLALAHARRCMEVVVASGLVDFDLVYAHEAMARALELAGEHAAADEAMAAARFVPVADPEDRAIVEADLAVPLR